MTRLDITVEIDWVRHGYSCANLLRDLSKGSSLIRPVITKDASLSDEGIEQAKGLNQLMNSESYIDRYDIILCSSMRRALETALYVFNSLKTKKKLVVVPFVSEARNIVAKKLNIDKENVPMGTKYLIPYFDMIKKEFGSDLNIDVDFTLLQQYENLGIDLSPSYENFVKKVLPEIIEGIGKPRVEDTYKIAIVSHNHFISHHFAMYGVKGIQNTEVWREKLVLEYKYAVNSFINIETKKPICPGLDRCERSICKMGTVCQVWEGVSESKKRSLGRCGKIHGKIYRTVGELALGQRPNTLCDWITGWIPSFGSVGLGSIGLGSGSDSDDQDKKYQEKYIKYKNKYLELKYQNN